MSPRFLVPKSWAEAQSSRAAAIRHAYPLCTRSCVRRLHISAQNPIESNGGNSPKDDQIHIIRKKTSRPRKIFSLIQPTGIPHLGNYLGALRTWKDFQDEKAGHGRPRQNHVLNFGIADLHSLTSKQDPEERRDQIRKTFASLLAIGLHIRHSLIFLQSDVPAHSELMWILSNVASTGPLSRMTQWKDKIGLKDPESSDRSLDNLDEKSQERLKLSLFSYPVLQAADILLYEPDSVPVGEDQAQHVEFTRRLARAFNSTYCPKDKPLFRVPELLLSPAKRIMSLQDPTKKMSKSDPDPMSRILITDTHEDIKLKLKKAKTDSVPGPITYSPTERPGVANLIDIYKHMSRNPKDQAAIATELRDMTLGGFKDMVADTVIKGLKGFRENYLNLIDEDNPVLTDAILRGRQLARARANMTMVKVREAVGLYTIADQKTLRKRANSKVQDMGEDSKMDDPQVDDTKAAEK